METTAVTTLTDCVEHVNRAMQSIKQNIIEIGNWLAKAKSILPHGEFGDWLKDNFSMTQQSAENYMRAAEVSSKIKNVLDFQPSALMEMAKLPSAEIENFTAENPNAATLSVRKLRGTIRQWKQAKQPKENIPVSATAPVRG